MALPHGAACRAARGAIGFHGCQLGGNGRLQDFYPADPGKWRLTAHYGKGCPSFKEKHEKMICKSAFFCWLSSYVGGFTDSFDCYPEPFRWNDPIWEARSSFFKWVGEKKLTSLSFEINRLRWTNILLMDENLHHLGWLKPYKWDNHHPWWCRILSMNRVPFKTQVISKIIFLFPFGWIC